MNKYLPFEKLKEILLYHKIVSWDKNVITLDNGVKVSIEMTDSDCCAKAYGEFTDVKLDAAIVSVSEPEYDHWSDDDTYGCTAVIKILYTDGSICTAEADADAGNGGYYYSIASFVVKFPNIEEETWIEFVSSEEDYL